jgi:hypothetical protein
MDRAVPGPDPLHPPCTLTRTELIVSTGPASVPRHHLRRTRARGVAIAATMAVVGAVLVAPASAEAATRPSSIEVIAASLQAGTIISDIATGKVTVDQLVDADLTAWAGGGSSVATPTRDEVTRQMTAEVTSLEVSGGLPATPDVDITASERGRVSASASTIGSSLFSFRRFVKHWTTITLDGRIAKLIVGGEGGIAAAFICATPGVGTLMCGFATAIIGVLVGIYVYYPICRGKNIYIKLPDVHNSHC